jgi:integrase
MRSAPETFGAKREAEQWLTVVESEVLRGDWSDPLAGRVALGEYGQRWIVEHRLGQRTREEYERLWRHHIQPYLGRVELAEISTDTIRSWRAMLLRGRCSEDRTAKAYRLLRAVLNTAVDDGKIKRTPCRIKGAGDYRAAERPTATIAQVYALAERMPERFRVLVLVAAFIGLRWGELIALRRCDVDLAGGVVHVRRRLAQPDRGGLQEGPPKSAAGARTLSLPEILVGELRLHIDRYAAPGPEGLVFCGPRVHR